jgi:hypothetical protein
MHWTKLSLTPFFPNNTREREKREKNEMFARRREWEKGNEKAENDPSLSSMTSRRAFKQIHGSLTLRLVAGFVGNGKRNQDTVQ